MPTVNTEEIIEKKASAPFATACLIIAAVALLLAIALQVTEIAEYRSGSLKSDKDPADAQVKADVNKYKEEVGDILSKTPKVEGDAAGGEAASGAGTAEEGDTKEEDAGSKAEADTKDAEATEDAEAEAPAKADAAAPEEPVEEAAEEESP